jgi:hypothetical protein
MTLSSNHRLEPDLRTRSQGSRALSAQPSVGYLETITSGSNQMKNSLTRTTITSVFLLLSALVCTSCVSTQSVVDRFGQKWIGQNFDEFVLRYGTPYRKFELNSGDIVYVWNSGTSSVAVPATATTNVYGNTAYTQLSGGENINMFCEMQLVTDRAGVIRQVIILKDTIGFWLPPDAMRFLNSLVDAQSINQPDYQKAALVAVRLF